MLTKRHKYTDLKTDENLVTYDDLFDGNPEQNEEGCFKFLKDYFKYTDEDLKIRDIEMNPFLIKDIENPSKRLQLVAVKKYGNSIKYIKNPSEEVQIAALKNDNDSIQYIENPSEEVQMIYCKKLHPFSKVALQEPCKKAQIEIIKKVSNLFKYQRSQWYSDGQIPIDFLLCYKLKETPLEIVLLAVKHQSVFKSSKIESMSEKFIMNYIDIEEVQIALVRRNYHHITKIKNPSKKVKLAYSLSKWDLIDYFRLNLTD